MGGGEGGVGERNIEDYRYRSKHIGSRRRGGRGRGEEDRRLSISIEKHRKVSKEERLLDLTLGL